MKPKLNTMIIVFITAIILSFAQNAKAAPPFQMPTNYPMGNPETITNYCVGKVTYLEAVLYRVEGPNNSTFIDERYLNRTFSSKEEVDSLARSWAQEMVAQYIAAGGERTGQFKISVFGESVDPFATVLFIPYIFTFPQSREGEVGAAAAPLPNFGSMSTILPSRIPYNVPAVNRVILQLTKKDGYKGVIDSKTSSSITVGGGVMRIETQYLVDPKWTRELIVITSSPKTYRVYNHQGNWVNERATRLELSNIGSTFTLSVNNCSAGRVYRVEELIDQEWTPTSHIFEGPYDWLGASTNFIIMSTNAAVNYRVNGDTSLLP